MAFWNVQAVDGLDNFVWMKHKYGPDPVFEFSAFVAGLREWSQHASSTQRRLPINTWIRSNLLFNGVGAYTATEFLQFWHRVTNLDPADPVASIIDDSSRFRCFCILLEEHMSLAMRNIRAECINSGTPSGCRPSLYHEWNYLRRLRTYRNSHSDVYLLPNCQKKVYFRGPVDATSRLRYLHPTANAFTANTLAVGPYAFLCGKEKFRFKQERPEYDITLVSSVAQKAFEQQQKAETASAPTGKRKRRNKRDRLRHRLNTNLHGFIEAAVSRFEKRLSSGPQWDLSFVPYDQVAKQAPLHGCVMSESMVKWKEAKDTKRQRAHTAENRKVLQNPLAHEKRGTRRKPRRKKSRKCSNSDEDWVAGNGV